jgi:hypothetical protein
LIKIRFSNNIQHKHIRSHRILGSIWRQSWRTNQHAGDIVPDIYRRLLRLWVWTQTLKNKTSQRLLQYVV